MAKIGYDWGLYKKEKETIDWGKLTEREKYAFELLKGIAASCSYYNDAATSRAFNYIDDFEKDIITRRKESSL